MFVSLFYLNFSKSYLKFYVYTLNKKYITKINNQ